MRLMLPGSPTIRCSLLECIVARTLTEPVRSQSTLKCLPVHVWEQVRMQQRTL